MPTYEYLCTACGRRTEAVQSFSDDPLTTCPHCGGQLRKVFGNIGIVLKGSGFYKNDSRAASNGARSSSAKREESESSSNKTAASKDTGSSTSEGAGSGSATPSSGASGDSGSSGASSTPPASSSASSGVSSH